MMLITDALKQRTISYSEMNVNDVTNVFTSMA